MQTPQLSFSPQRLHDILGHYLKFRIQVVPALNDVLTFFSARQAELEGDINMMREARLDRQMKLAFRDYQNDLMDQEVRVLAYTILGLVNNNRNAPIFRYYFDETVSDYVRTPLSKQRRRARVILDKLERETDETVFSRFEPFRNTLEALELAIQEYSKALDTEASQRAQLLTAKADWIAGYRKTYDMIRDVFRNDPSKAENFFRVLKPRKSGLEIVDDDTPEEELQDAEDGEELTIVDNSGTEPPSGDPDTGNSTWNNTTEDETEEDGGIHARAGE